MNIKQAQYIQTIASEGSITAAAKKLYISQPSLSQMVRQVEKELGVTLFDRTSLPLRLTYAGECAEGNEDPSPGNAEIYCPLSQCVAGIAGDGVRENGRSSSVR